MKNIAKIVLGLTALIALGSANAYIEEIEKGYEVNELRVTLNTPSKGTVIVRECDTCPDVTLQISADTKAFKANAPIPLTEVVRYMGKPGVVFRKIDTDQVTRIKIY